MSCFHRGACRTWFPVHPAPVRHPRLPGRSGIAAPAILEHVARVGYCIPEGPPESCKRCTACSRRRCLACCSEASRPAALGNGRATLCLGFPAKLHRAATAADHERSRHPIRHRNDATMGTRSATQTTRRQAESAGNFERRYRTAVCITMRIPTPEKNIMIDIMRSRPEPSCISRHIAIIVI